MSSSAVMLVVVLMALTLARHAVLALVFELPDKQEICFYEDFEDNERQEVIYKVIHGGKHDIDVTIKNPQGVAIYKKIQERHGNFKFSTEAGKYTFCFGNKFSTVTHKTIHFVLRSQILKTQSAQLGDNTYRVNTKSEEYLEKVFQHCETIIRYQTHYRVNEALGRYGAEELRVRVQWWSFAEALIIMCSGLGQVLILKTFFTDRHAKKPRAQPGTNPMPPLSTPPLGAPPLSTPPLLLPTNKL